VRKPRAADAIRAERFCKKWAGGNPRAVKSLISLLNCATRRGRLEEFFYLENAPNDELPARFRQPEVSPLNRAECECVWPDHLNYGAQCGANEFLYPITRVHENEERRVMWVCASCYRALRTRDAMQRFAWPKHDRKGVNREHRKDIESQSKCCGRRVSDEATLPVVLQRVRRLA